MSCPICRRAKCIWIELPKRTTVQKLERIISHNLDYTDYLARDGKLGAAGEERLFKMMTPFYDKLEELKSEEK